MGLLSKASKLAKVAKKAKKAKKTVDKNKSAIRKIFDELPESEKAELPSQPDDGSLIGYHGTAKERSADEPFFDIDFARKQDQFMGEGFYFTIDPNIASEYANMRAFKDFDIEGSDGKGGSLLRKRDSGVLTSTSKLLEGLDIDDNPIAMNQSISRFDLSGLEKPYVVKNNKDRLYLKDNIEKIKKQGYDSVLFAEFGDRSKQIMVFPEHMDKIDTTEMASVKMAAIKTLDAGGLLTTNLTSNRSTMSINPILKHHYENIATDSAVRNEDGSLSTVKTAIVEIDGKETLIPTVWNGEILEGDRLNEAIDNAVNSGKKWPNIDAENVKAIERLNNLDKLLHQDMKPISRKEAQEVLIDEFSKKRTLNKDSLKPVFSTTSSEDVMLPENTNDAIYQPTEKGLLDKFKNSPLKYIKDLNLMGSDKRIELGNTIEFNKGGTPMIQKQMEMFEDGGLKDQGGTVDPMSGNDVPVGSTQKEVRDDIPAQLSEGEFVFPADVVRFIGLEKLMGLRQQAKMGLKKMEDMGQMGNSDEATMPDDMPFGMADLIVMSPEGRQVEMAEGGVVQAATGVNVTPSTRGSTTGVTRTNNVTPTSSNFSAPTTRPLVTGTSNTRPRPNVPTFEDSMGQASITLIQYQNAEGATLMVPHMGGKPIYPVPAGYYEVNADGTPVNPEDVPAAGAGDTTTQPVKPIEVRDSSQEIDAVAQANNAKAAISNGVLASGNRKPTAFETYIMGTKMYDSLTKLALSKAGKTVPSTAKERHRSFAMLGLENSMRGYEPGTPEHSALADTLAETREFTTDNSGNQVPSGANPSRKTSIPTTSKYYNQVPSSKPDDLQSNVTSDVTPENIPAFELGGRETPTEISTPETIPAFELGGRGTPTVPPATNYDDPNVITPPKVEEVVNVLTSEGIQNMYTPSADFTDVDFGEYSPPQKSLDQYNLANPTYEGLTTKDGELMGALGDDIKSYVSSIAPNTLMKADEKSRAKAAEEFARAEEARAAEELAAAQQQLADLQAAAEAKAAAEARAAAAAKAKADAEKEQAAIDYTISQPSGGTSYTAPSTPTGGSAGYSGSYNEPGRGDGPDGPDGNGGGGGGSGGGGGGNSGGSAGGGGGPYNKGGLAAKKTKKKPTKRYKKGGLAASKK